MNIKIEGSEFRLDALKWAIIFGLVFGSVYVNSMYAAESPLLRALSGVVVGIVIVIISLQTAKGNAVWELAKEAKVEIRKVVWPTTQELTQTTLIVVAVVIFVGFILWGLDSGLSWGIKSIIG